jgi:hypothetical protein
MIHDLLPKLFSAVSAALIVTGLLTPSTVDCHAIDYDNFELVCEGGCGPGTGPCREISHTSGVTFCGCSDGEPLPTCCELAEWGGDVTTVGDCQGQGCNSSGVCNKREVEQPNWRHWQAYCTGTDG